MFGEKFLLRAIEIQILFCTFEKQRCIFFSTLPHNLSGRTYFIFSPCLSCEGKEVWPCGQNSSLRILTCKLSL